MTIPPLLNPLFWFNPLPPPFIPVIDRILFFGSFAFIVIGIGVHVWRKRMTGDRLMKQAVGRKGTLLLTSGFISLVLYALAYERVRYLSMRAFWLALGCWFLWEAWKIYRFVTVKIPEIQKAKSEREAFERWLPKPKR